MVAIWVLCLVGFPLSSGFDSDTISDIVSPAADERRSLDIKSQEFWKPIQESAEEAAILNHASVYAEVETAIAGLPSENAHVRGLMQEALMRVRRADETVLRQASQSTDIASERLAAGPTADSMFSFMTGGQNYFQLAIRRFIGVADYADRVSKHVSSRQADVLPALRGAATINGNVFDDCRRASTLGFDVIKYDLYNEGVPETPAATLAAAYKLVDAVGETRHHFMKGIIGIASALTKDTQEKDVNPSAKVTQTLFSDLEPLEVRLDGKQKTPTVHDEPLLIGSDHDEPLFIESDTLVGYSVI